MQEIPVLSARYAPQPAGVAWPTSDWPEATSGAPRALAEAVDEAFSDPRLGTTNVVLVVRAGQILVERYDGVQEFFDRDPEPITASSRLLSWSMAKSILHMIVGTLVDDGRLDPAQRARVAEWDNASDPRYAITTADLLAMRDGLAFVEKYEIGQPSDVIDMLFGDGRHDVADYAVRLPLAHAPGTVFNYSSGTTNIISRVVADEVGRAEDYRRYLHERLFAPLGMQSAEATFDDAGVFVASSYVHATARDFAKFGLLYLRGGQWGDRQLISRAWTDTAQVPLSVDVDSDHFYSWQWWLNADPYGTYWAAGYEGQMICVVPGLDALIVRFGHTPHESYPALYEWRRRVIDALATTQAPS